MDYDNYFGNESRRTPAFYIAMLLILLLFILMLNTDLAQFSQHKDTGVPAWFFDVVFPVDFVILASVILMLLYRRIGVYIFPVFVLLHHVLYEFYLSTTLLSGLHLLFVFIGAGLLVIIPRWKYYR